MADRHSRGSPGARALGALVVVVLVAVLVARYVIHDDPKRRDATDAPPVTRYPSALQAGSIRAMSSGADVMLAVGDDGAIMRQRLGSTWTAEASPTRATLRGVAQQLDEAIAVGDGGTVVELEGGHWRLASSPTQRTLRAVVYTSYGAIAVGDGGTVMRRSAPHEPWQIEPGAEASDYYGACAGLRDVWVVGRGGAIALRDFVAWKAQPPISPATLYAVACDDHAAIAVGERGTVLQRLDDVGWHATPSGVDADLYAASGSVGTTSWLAVGASGVVLRISGSASREPTGVDWDLRAVTEGALGTWMGGEKGILRRAL